MWSPRTLLTQLWRLCAKNKLLEHTLPFPFCLFLDRKNGGKGNVQSEWWWWCLIDKGWSTQRVGGIDETNFQFAERDISCFLLKHMMSWEYWLLYLDWIWVDIYMVDWVAHRRKSHCLRQSGSCSARHSGTCWECVSTLFTRRITHPLQITCGKS